MEVTHREVTVRELVEDYCDDGEHGVTGYGGRLDIRPKYQREFVYELPQQEAVIHTVNRGFPLNVMYWADRGDDEYEVIDGQQRTISIAKYVAGDFALELDALPEERFFENLPSDIQQRVLDYKLMVYVCTGTDSEKLAWFETVNIAGERLTRQELRNAVFCGTWVSDAKRYFSKTDGPAKDMGGDYVRGKPNRQDFLETAIKWISGDRIEEYMGLHQKDPNAKPLWNHFRAVIRWVKSVFKTRPKLMRGVDWGALYTEYHTRKLDPDAIEAETVRLLDDDEVERQSGIYAYILTGEEKHLNLRAFPDKIKRRKYREQEGICAPCDTWFAFKDMEADHIDPWSEGGRTILTNCQMLCKPCNRRKSNK